MTKPDGNDRNKTWFNAFEQFAHFSFFFGMQIYTGYGVWGRRFF